MSTLSQSVPASFRAPLQARPLPAKPLQARPLQTSRFAASLLPGGRHSEFDTPEKIPVAIDSSVKSRFARLPHEPEDARMTGVTRSLHRRLLALNLRGSLVERHLNASQARIA